LHISNSLFLLCAEGFSALLTAAELEGRIHGIRLCRGAPISYTVHANVAEAEVLQQLLNVYEECSGQVINNAKSAIMFVARKAQRDVTVLAGSSQGASDFWTKLWKLECLPKIKHFL
jgi:hypothetical protein